MGRSNRFQASRGLYPIMPVTCCYYLGGKPISTRPMNRQPYKGAWQYAQPEWLSGHLEGERKDRSTHSVVTFPLVSAFELVVDFVVTLANIELFNDLRLTLIPMYTPISRQFYS